MMFEAVKSDDVQADSSEAGVMSDCPFSIKLYWAIDPEQELPVSAITS